ncbi:MAG TPA: TRAM domain-containing protein, partial [Acidimicrobiia bacterium]
MAHGGRAVGHTDGQVVFVAGAYPGEVVVAEVTRVSSRHLFA